MRSLSLQSIRSAGVGSALNSGLTVQWLAAASTVAAPTTIWSENTGDAANQIIVKYNGSAVYITKRIASVNTYVSVPFTATNGVVYSVKIILNADNTLQLIVNGTAASSGLGAERWTSTYTLGVWTDSGTTFDCAGSSGLLTATGGAGVVAGRLYYGVAEITSYTSGTFTVPYGGTAAPTAVFGVGIKSAVSIPTTTLGNVYINSASLFNGKILKSSVSMKEVFNNTDTTAIPWSTVL